MYFDTMTKIAFPLIGLLITLLFLEYTMIMLDTPEQIQMARYLTMRSGLQLEVKGMRLTRGLSCYKMIKRYLWFER